MSQGQRQRPGSSHFSRPAAGGGGRSFSSQHQPAAGTRQEDPPFVRAIFKRINLEAQNDSIDLNLVEVRDFATKYAEANPPRNPPKGMIFGQDHVEAALEQFKKLYEPPQPSPQPPSRPQRPPQLPHNPANLFGQLMAVAKCWHVPNELTINYLKWYTSQPHISQIAQNPSHQDFISAVEEMRRAISPAATMVATIRERGLSQETIGTNVFGELMKMSNGPAAKQVWAFDACPDPVLLQYAITLKKVGPFDHVTGFIKGVFFDQTGQATHFNWPNFKFETGAPKSMIGSHALVWASEVGEPVYTKGLKDFSGVTLEAQTEFATTGSYGGACSYEGFGRDDYRDLKLAITMRVSNVMNEDRDRFFERPHVTADTKINLSKEHEQLIRSNPTYIQLVNEAMFRIGGTLLPSSLSSAATAATEDLAPSAPNAEDDIILCYHFSVVMNSSGECTPCATCLEGPPGRGKIFDEWGKTIAYKYKN